MRSNSSKLEEIFSDTRDSAERGDRLEKVKDGLRKARERRDRGVDAFIPAPRNEPDYDGPIGIVKGVGAGFAARNKRVDEAAERFHTIAKSVSPDERAQIEAALQDIRAMQDEYTGMVGKDITVGGPGNLHPYDLEALKWVVPMFTPLVNEISRKKGAGTAREFRRILGITNSGLGGVADQLPFFNSESDTGAPVFGQLGLRRGQKIQYATDTHVVPYVEMSVSDEVTDKAYFSDLGFENVDELSAMALGWAHKLGEEKSYLLARGSMQGFAGAVAAPVISSAVSSTTAGGITVAALYFKVTARAGGGESVVSNETSVTGMTGTTNQVTITVTTEPVGGLSYNLYAGTASGGEKFITSFVGNTIVLNTFTAGSINPPAADSTANPNGYDGFLTVLADPNQSGYVARQNGPLYVPGGSSNAGDTPIQNMFASLWSSVYADPEELWMTAPIKRELIDFVRASNGGAAAYRIQLTDTGNVVIGGAVDGIMNESSPNDRIVDARVHPYMPSGALFARTRTLNVPNSGIGDTSQIIAPQDYMMVDWPRIQFTRDRSTYWYGVLLHYAPKWSGAILGIQ